ncbi:MAG TPA: RagB/SusD family nutrient uptake outer membrane protein [Hanamia sp.]|nr:RagB/SusD family nutrient uptake outer membrane protein [Hanamia sp.]
MKLSNYIQFAAILTGIILLSSCKKYLTENPLSSFGPNAVFGTVNNAQKAVLGVYQELTGDQGYGCRISMYYPYDNDQMMGAAGSGDNDRRDLARYTYTSGNLQIAKPFNQLYEGIERANQCIYYIPKMSLYTSGNAQQIGELQRLYGEALTLRAQFYFELVRDWGDVPAQWLPSAQLANLSLPETDRDSIYDHILNDLQIAEPLVPWRTDVSALGDPNDERITKGAVKGLRARIALYRGGYSLRAFNSQMARDADFMDYYKIADTECLAIMNRPDEHTLDPNYQDLWQNYICGHKMDPYGEVMFQVAMSGGTGATDSKLGYYNGPRTNGKGNSSLTILPTYFYSFDSLDTRRDVICAPYEISSASAYVGHPITNIIDGKFRRDWTTNPSITPTSNAQYMGINWPILRFSDILLMYAEAENMINSGPTPGAIAALDRVRARAFGANASQIGTPPGDQAGFQQAIINERGWEFGDEGIRKFDLIRWNLLGTYLANAKAALANIASGASPYSNDASNMYYLNNSTNGLVWGNSFYNPSASTTPSGYTGVPWAGSATITSTYLSNGAASLASGFVANHSELYPIPISVLQSNPNLVQHYGY